MKVVIPEYLTVEQYLKLQYLNDIDQPHDKVLYTISSIINVPMEELEKWPLTAIRQVNIEITELLNKVNTEFYPVVKWNGILYGYRAVHKMSMAEYVDVSQLCTKPSQNMTEILALLYRPITKNKLNTTKYITKSTLKAVKYDVENVFDYYELEQYDAVTRKQQAEEYKQFPAEIGLGALNFFMLVGLSSSKNMTSYFPSMKEMIMTLKMSKIKSALVRIIAGYTFSTKLLKHKSYKSLETKQ